MLKKLLVFVLLVHEVVHAQNIPLFNPKSITLRIPAFIPGIMKDSSAVLLNDTLIYTLKGQLFGKGLTMNPVKSPLPLKTPFETLYEMKNAYSNKNSKKIIELYNSDSKSRIKNILNGPEATQFLDYVSQSAPTLRIMAGLNYKNGFAVYTKDVNNVLHENFIKIEKGVYKLSALKDNASTGWNLALYFKYEPKPLIPLPNVKVPDSLKEKDSSTVIVMLPEPDRWVAVYLGQAGPVMLLAKDNGLNDFDSVKNQVTLHFKGSMFFNPGTYNYYISSLNFPVQRVSSNMITDLALHTIKIK